MIGIRKRKHNLSGTRATVRPDSRIEEVPSTLPVCANTGYLSLLFHCREIEETIFTCFYVGIYTRGYTFKQFLL